MSKTGGAMLSRFSYVRTDFYVIISAKHTGYCQEIAYLHPALLRNMMMRRLKSYFLKKRLQPLPIKMKYFIRILPAALLLIFMAGRGSACQADVVPTTGLLGYHSTETAREDTLSTARPIVIIQGQAIRDTLFYFSRSTELRFETGSSNTRIYYSKGNAMPGEKSEIYNRPLLLSASGTLKYMAIEPGRKESPVGTLHFIRVEGIEDIRLMRPLCVNSPGGNKFLLLDGKTGDANPDHPAWLAFGAGGAAIELNLGIIREINAVLVNFLSAPAQGVPSPAKIVVEGSADGRTFNKLYSKRIRKPESCRPLAIWYKALLKGEKARWLRITFKSPRKCKADKCCILISEIRAEASH